MIEEQLLIGGGLMKKIELGVEEGKYWDRRNEDAEGEEKQYL